MPLAAIAIVASAVGGGLSAYNTYQQGKSAQQLNNYNAALSNQQATTTQRDAAIQANAQRASNERIMARQRAARGADGVVGSTGSPLLVEAAQAGYMEQEASETNRVGRAKSDAYRSQAEIDMMQGKSARRAGNIGAAATLLSTAGSVGAGYYGLQ